MWVVVVGRAEDERMDVEGRALGRRAVVARMFQRGRRCRLGGCRGRRSKIGLVFMSTRLGV